MSDRCLVAEQGLLEDVHAERLAKAAEDIIEVDEHGKKLTKKQQAAAKKKADAERTKQSQDEGTRIDPKVTRLTLVPMLHDCKGHLRLNCAECDSGYHITIQF
jgi:hypothetical protein